MLTAGSVEAARRRECTCYRVISFGGCNCAKVTVNSSYKENRAAVEYGCGVIASTGNQVTSRGKRSRYRAVEFCARKRIEVSVLTASDKYAAVVQSRCGVMRAGRGQTAPPM